MLKIIFWLLLHAVGVISFAQSLTVMGTVQNENGEAIAGAFMEIMDTKKVSISDINGHFAIEGIRGEVLVVASLGYQSQQVVMEDSSITITLQEDFQQLTEVVVTAFGIKRSTKSLGYNVQRIESADLTNAPTPNFIDNIAGKFSGVTVTQGATGVGSSSKIVIRGESSTTSNNPLFVVDGTPINNNSILNFTNDAAAGFQEVDFGNGAMDLASEDIASVSVLKGPSAAALYGSRAASGVIVITTKAGRTREGIGVSLSSSVVFSRPFRLPQFQNRYGQGNAGQFQYVDGLGGGVNDNISYSWGPILDQGIEIPQFNSPVRLPDGTIVRGGDVGVHGNGIIIPTPFISHSDNLKDFYITGITTNNYASVKSNFEKGKFRMSIANMNSESIIPGVNLERTNIGTKLIVRPTQKLKIQSSLNYIKTGSDNRPSGGYGSENINYSLVAWGPRSLDIAGLKNYWQPGLEGLQQYSFNYTFFDNPYFILKENRNSFERNRAFGNLSAQYFINDRWSLSLRSGLDYSSEKRQFRRAYSTNRFRNGGFAVHDVGYEERNSDFLLNYNLEKSNYTFDLNFGGNRLDQQAATVQNQANELAQPGIFNLSNAAVPIEVFEFSSHKRINSLFAVVKFCYRDYLFTELTARNDWSSALATPISNKNTSFFYPSISNALLISSVIDLPRQINFFKLRASWAQVGNDTNPYQTAGVFTAQTPYLGNPTFSAQPTIFNSGLSPEVTSAWEFGTELGLWNNALTFDFTYYDALTTDQIISLPIAASSGYEEQVVNGGEVRSRGIEIILHYDVLKKTGLRWAASFNFSKNVTTVEQLPEGVERLTLAYSRIYDNVNQTVFFQVEEGGRVGDMYGTGYLKNDNGEFVIGENGLFIPDNSLKKLGNYNPDFMLSSIQRFNYRELELQLVFDWRFGGVLVSRTQALAGVGGQLKETGLRPAGGLIAEGVINVGSDVAPQYQPNDIVVSAEAYYRSYYDRNHEENNTYNASYLKLREVSLGYDLGQKMNWKTSLKLSVIGRNIFAFSEIPHFDPEQLAVQGQQFVNGVEDMSYASTRSLGLKMDLNF